MGDFGFQAVTLMLPDLEEKYMLLFEAFACEIKSLS